MNEVLKEMMSDREELRKIREEAREDAREAKKDARRREQEAIRREQDLFELLRSQPQTQPQTQTQTQIQPAPLQHQHNQKQVNTELLELRRNKKAEAELAESRQFQARQSEQIAHLLKVVAAQSVQLKNFVLQKNSSVAPYELPLEEEPEEEPAEINPTPTLTPAPTPILTPTLTPTPIQTWIAVAEDMYSMRCNKQEINFTKVNQAMDQNKSLFAAVNQTCPQFSNILSHLFVIRFGWRVKTVDWMSSMNSWGDEEAIRLGSSAAVFLRNSQTGAAALSSYRLHYPQMDALFSSDPGLEAFMLTLFKNLLRDSMYGMIFRVFVGAILSTVDAGTDLYVLSTYYKSGKLNGQANMLLCMIGCNMFAQFLVVQMQYKSHGWKRKLYEMVICLCFMRPIVDAYRVSLGQEEDDTSVNQLTEMGFNKGKF